MSGHPLDNPNPKADGIVKRSVALQFCLLVVGLGMCLVIVGYWIWGESACAICKFSEAVTTVPVYTPRQTLDVDSGTVPYWNDSVYRTRQQIPVCATHHRNRIRGPYDPLILGHVWWPLYLIGPGLLLLMLANELWTRFRLWLS